MTPLSPILPGALVLWPLLAALALGLVRDWRLGATLNLAASGVTFLLAQGLLAEPVVVGEMLRLDPFAAALGWLTAFVGLTTAWFSRGYVAVELATERLTPLRLRFYHACFQGFLAALMLGLFAENLGLLWVGLEAATIIAVLMVALYRTPPSYEAAWKYFILCGVGIALALFGTVLFYLAALPELGPGWNAMGWSGLTASASRMPPALLDLAFLFLLVGYGTKAGLVPMHAWVPDAHAEGPTPISAVLSGLLLNVALAALVRASHVVSAQPASIPVGGLLMAVGLASLLLAAFSLWRRRDVKRFFGWSSIEHMGIAAFAFGLGGQQAATAGLLHMAMHCIVKSGIFFAVGSAAQARGGQRFTDITGLATSHPFLALGLGFLVAAIAGLPPFGLFSSEFLLLSRTVAVAPWAALLLAVGFVVALCAMLSRAPGLFWGPVPEGRGVAIPSASVLGPVYLHLAMAIGGGLLLPGVIGDWLGRIAAGLG